MAVPNLAGVLNGWMKKYTISIVTKTITNHKVVETFTDYTAKMLKVPMPPQQVARKPEEQRSWKWWTITMKTGPALKIDDRVLIDGMTYRVQIKNDWKDSGFIYYEVTEDYQE